DIENHIDGSLAQSGAFTDGPAQRIAVSGREGRVDVHERSRTPSDDRWVQPDSHGELVPHGKRLAELREVGIKGGLAFRDPPEGLRLEECLRCGIDGDLSDLLPRLVQYDGRRLRIPAHVEFPAR